MAPGVDEARAAELFETIRREVEGHSFAVGDRTHHMTVSIGVTLEKGSLDDMIERADKMLYAAKEAGRNRVMVGP